MLVPPGSTYGVTNVRGDFTVTVVAFGRVEPASAGWPAPDPASGQRTASFVTCVNPDPRFALYTFDIVQRLPNGVNYPIGREDHLYNDIPPGYPRPPVENCSVPPPPESTGGE